jgi:DNA-binding transcriptional regulator LsrR (DeoR family)
LELKNETILMNKVVWYYYFGNLTQQNISELLGISRARIIRLLEKARETGVIQFRMHPEHGHRMETETRLACLWDLKDVMIVPTASDGMNTNENIANAAAIYINNLVPENAYINVGYGDTLNRMVNRLAQITESTVSIVSLTGGVNCYLPNASSSIFNARLYLTPAPILMSSPEMVAAINNEPSVRQIAQMVKLSFLTVVGIGAMDDNATVLRDGIIGKNDFIFLSMQGAVGDILCHFLDRDGKPILSDVENRLISTPLEALQNLNNVIGVAGGRHKVDAIRSVLKGHYLDVLITDEETAELLTVS